MLDRINRIGRIFGCFATSSGRKSCYPIRLRRNSKLEALILGCGAGQGQVRQTAGQGDHRCGHGKQEALQSQPIAAPRSGLMPPEVLPILGYRGTSEHIQCLLSEARARERAWRLVAVENLSVPFDRRVWHECTTLVAAGVRGVGRSARGASAMRPRRPYAGAGRRCGCTGTPRRPAPARWPVATRSEYPFMLAWTLRLAWRIWRERGFDVLHACNPPDLFFLIGRVFRPFGVIRSSTTSTTPTPRSSSPSAGERSAKAFRSALCAGLSAAPKRARRRRRLSQQTRTGPWLSRVAARARTTSSWCAARPGWRSSCRSQATASTGAGAPLSGRLPVGVMGKQDGVDVLGARRRGPGGRRPR